MDKYSYTAANTFPIKILKHKKLLKALFGGRIIPIHIQLNPCNRCNLKCQFCSCSKRDVGLELSYKAINNIIKKVVDLGCEAVTITGGGEPLMHPKINGIIKDFISQEILVGLVSNGLLLDKLHNKILNKITWCRISCSDERPFNKEKVSHLIKAINHAPKVDWAFSYVVTKDVDISNIIKYIEFANDYKFTHIRIVSDLINMVDELPSMKYIKKEIQQAGADDSKVNYQGRKLFDKGQEKCYISLLKPNIDAKGDIYPCCGSQFSLFQPDLDYSQKMRMGSIKDIEDIYSKQQYFNGSICYRCYYKTYNDVLGNLLNTNKLQHKEFV